MRKTYVVTYDVCDPKRLRKVYKTMRGYGDHVQLSVFRCDLTPTELFELRGKLGALIHHGEDQVMFVDVGPSQGRGGGSIRTIGKAVATVERTAIVV